MYLIISNSNNYKILSKQNALYLLIVNQTLLFFCTIDWFHYCWNEYVKSFDQFCKLEENLMKVHSHGYKTGSRKIQKNCTAVLTVTVIVMILLFLEFLTSVIVF